MAAHIALLDHASHGLAAAAALLRALAADAIDCSVAQRAIAIAATAPATCVTDAALAAAAALLLHGGCLWRALLPWACTIPAAVAKSRPSTRPHVMQRVLVMLGGAPAVPLVLSDAAHRHR